MSRSLTVTSGCFSVIAQYLGAVSASVAPGTASHVVVGSGMAPVDPRLSNMPLWEIYRLPVTHRIPVPAGGVSFHSYLDIDDQPALDGIDGMSVSAYGVFAGGTQTSGTGTLILAANSPMVFNKNPSNAVSPDFTLLLSGTQGGTGLVATSGMRSLLTDYLSSPRAAAAPAPPSYVTFGTVGISGGYFATNVPGWEIYRAPIINRQIRSIADATQVILSFLIPSGSAAGVTLRTMGIMAGAATASSGTGTLIGVGYFPSPVVKTAFMLVSGNLAYTISGMGV